MPDITTPDDGDAQPAARTPRGPRLSSGEAAVLILMAGGLRTDGIAARLRRTQGAVISTIRRARDKVGGTTQHTMVDRAYRSGHLPAPAHRRRPPGTDLDPEQRRILLLLAAGATAAEIASDVLLSPVVAEGRIRAVRRALGADTNAHAIHLGWELGYLHPGEAPPTSLSRQPCRTTGSGTHLGGANASAAGPPAAP